MKVSPKWPWKQRRQTSRYGRCSWLHRCKQHCTWTQVSQRTWKYSRILDLSLLKSCSILQERWLGKIQKLWMCLPGKLWALPGTDLQCWTIKQPSRQKHEQTYTRIPCYAWEDWPLRMLQSDDGKIKCQLWRCAVLSESCKDWMENASNSSGKISKDTAHCSFSTIQKDLERNHIIPENFSDRIIFMSLFNTIELEKRGNEDSCALTSRAIRDYSSRFKDGHWAFLGLGEENKYHDNATVLKANGTFVLQEWWMISRIRDIQDSKQSVRWAVKYWKGKTTETPSISMQNINRMLQNVESLESMPQRSQIESLRTTAVLYHPVKKRRIYITTLHKEDGWEKARLCVINTQNPETKNIRCHMLRLMQNNRLVQSWMLGLRKFLMSMVSKCKFNHWVIQNSPHGFW